MKNEQINAALDWRYATKQYDSTRDISNDDWATIESALIKAPSSYGLQPVKYLIIETPELRSELRAVSWNQTQVTDASKFLVILAKDNLTSDDVQEYIERIAKTRSISKESLKGYQDMMLSKVESLTGSEALEWNKRQAYLALGFAIETAALLEIDATPMEGFDPLAYDRILGLENSGWRSTVVAAFGYRHNEDASQNYKKVRHLNSNIVQYR